MRVMIPRAVLSTSAAGGSRRKKWRRRRWRRHGEVGRKRVRDSSVVGVNRRWRVFNGSPRESWSLSVTPFEKHITSTWTSAGAHAVTALCCCLNTIKRRHVGVLLLLYILFLRWWNESETFAFKTKKMLLLLLSQLWICIISRSIIILGLACATHHVLFFFCFYPFEGNISNNKK